MIKIKVSIIIVHYKVEKELIACIRSIYKQRTNVKYEIIVVDNDEKETIKKNILKLFPNVLFIKSKENVGYGQGNNIGAKYAQGEYLFILNPDTVLQQNVLKNLSDFLDQNKNAGIVAPILLNKDNKPYKYQGSRTLTPLNSLFVLSIINKFLPQNVISRKFWYQNWNKKDVMKVDVVPGSALMVKKHLFKNVGGFDRNFFLYFEEYDLCKRISLLGYFIYMLPTAKIKHHWGRSTGKSVEVNKYYYKSRDYYFSKHYGKIVSMLCIKFPLFLLSKNGAIFIFILIVGIFLRLYKINELVPFIGDQGWFYLSARDMVQTGNIPLVGITSSHTWLHQGPFWTYILAFSFLLFGFEVESGASISAFIGILSIVVFYIFAKKIFDDRIALIGSLLYSTSPLIVLNSRMPYHTSPIPLFTTLFLFCCYLVFKGRRKFIPPSFFILGVLYNFQLTTQVFWTFLFFLFVFIFFKNKQYARSLFNFKLIVISIISFLIPMLPIVLYDVKNGFLQTLGFAAWAFKAPLSFVIEGDLSKQNSSFFYEFLLEHNRRFFFDGSSIISLMMFFSVVMYILWSLLKGKIDQRWLFLFVSTAIPIAGLFAIGNPSEAYLPIMFSQLILGFSVIAGSNYKNIFFNNIVIILLVLIAFFNAGQIIKKNFFLDRENGYGFSLKYQNEAVKQSVYKMAGKDFKVSVDWGPGVKVPESTAMGYEFIAWSLGADVNPRSSRQLFFSTSSKGIMVHLLENNKKELLYMQKVPYKVHEE